MLTIASSKYDYIGSNRNQFYIKIDFYIDRKEDAFILQDYIRAKMNQFCVESYFGYDDNFNEILEVDYSCKPYLNSFLINYDPEVSEINFILTKKKTNKN